MVTSRFSQRGLNTRSKAAGDQYLNSVEPQGIVYAAVYCIVTVQRARRPPLLSLSDKKKDFLAFPIRKFKLHLLPLPKAQVRGFSQKLTHAGCEAYAQLFRIVIIIISSSRIISAFFIIYRGRLDLVLQRMRALVYHFKAFCSCGGKSQRQTNPRHLRSLTADITILCLSIT